MKSFVTILSILPAKGKRSFLFALIAIGPHLSNAQESVFSLFKNTDKQADEYYNAKDFQQALNLYLSLIHKSKSYEQGVKIARCYYYLNQPSNTATWYERSLTEMKTLPEKDMYRYAETLSTLGQYDKAIIWYTQYLQQNNDDPIVVKKIWRLKNIESLYEDSIHYVVSQLTINSASGDFCPVVYQQGLVFLSNRLSKTSDNLYKLYYSRTVSDTTSDGIVSTKFEKPVSFAKELKTKFNQGPVAFYDDGKRMVYTATGEPSKKDKDARTLQLSFADLQNGSWVITGTFPFNSTEYSVTDPAISKDGKDLYFSSDMNGGFGGRDLYKSTFENGTWSKPINLGDQINTLGDESFPFLTGNYLYFTSNGHPGLGGLDIFYVTIFDDHYGEAENMGYPVNTHADEFTITLNEERNQGYFASNRKGNHDDIYSLSINLQTYPMTINGLLQYKEESWNDSTELKILPNAQLFLIDNNKNMTVQASASDAQGNFSLTIPYFSQYKLKVVENNNGSEAFVSFDLSKQRNAENIYKIVVVKKSF